MTRVLFFNSINMTPGKVMMIGLFRCFANLTPGDDIKNKDTNGRRPGVTV